MLAGKSIRYWTILTVWLMMSVIVGLVIGSYLQAHGW